MTTVTDRDYLGLPEVAERLGVHRATANEMVRSGRLRATREGARWIVRRDVLDQFASSYTRPANAPDRRPPATEPPTAGPIRELLAEFGSASAIELAPLLQLHEGNVRKHLRLLQVAGVVSRRPDGQWVLSK